MHIHGLQADLNAIVKYIDDNNLNQYVENGWYTVVVIM